MKTRLTKEKVKEESDIKKELLRWWNTLGLKIMYFNNAVELQAESLKMDYLYKYWLDNYDILKGKYNLLKKDNELLIERIRELENGNKSKARKSRTRNKQD